MVAAHWIPQTRQLTPLSMRNEVGWVEPTGPAEVAGPMAGSAKPIAFSRAMLARWNYRRNFIRGRSFFFTANPTERRLRLLIDYIDLLRQAYCYVRRRHPFDIESIVVLPDHLHAIWTLPEGDADFALRWRLIKSIFSRGLPAGERRSASRAKKGERGIWQRRYWERALRDETGQSKGATFRHLSVPQ
jgi:putative transposase